MTAVVLVGLLIIVGVPVACIAIGVLVSQAKRPSTDVEHAAYTVVVGSSKAEILAELGEPESGKRTDARKTDAPPNVMTLNEYWFYRDTPDGHDTMVTIDWRGLTKAVQVVPKPGNRCGRARHAVSAPDRKQPMAEMWRENLSRILKSEDNIEKAIAEFSETLNIEYVEGELTDEQLKYRNDDDYLDSLIALPDARIPRWLETPYAIRYIGHHLSKLGGLQLMQSTLRRASAWSSTGSVTSTIDRYWDGIGEWRR